MKITIDEVVNHGEFLQAFATVEEGKEQKQVSFCFKSLPFTEDGVFNALMCKFSEPKVVEPVPTEPPEIEPIEPVPYVPDKERIASVKALEDIFKALPAEDKKVIFPTVVEIEQVEEKVVLR